MQYYATHNFFLSDLNAVYLLLINYWPPEAKTDASLDIAQHAEDRCLFWLSCLSARLSGERSKHAAVILVGTHADMFEQHFRSPPPIEQLTQRMREHFPSLEVVDGRSLDYGKINDTSCNVTGLLSSVLR